MALMNKMTSENMEISTYAFPRQLDKLHLLMDITCYYSYLKDLKLTIFSTAVSNNQLTQNLREYVSDKGPFCIIYYFIFNEHFMHYLYKTAVNIKGYIDNF